MKDPGSFRDPSGHVFFENGKVFRVVNKSYFSNYEHLINSGLYSELTNRNLLVNHNELENKNQNQPLILEVEKISPITYPYEWCFSQLKDAALITLQVQKISLDFGMTLKDATPYNIQFKESKPIFIDTLSFEKIKNDNYAWVAYKQYCEMFLSTLCLMSYKDPSLNKLLIPFLDGIPLSLSNKLLPFKKKFNPTIFLNLVLPRFISTKLNNKNSYSSSRLSKKQHLNIIEQLIIFIEKMEIIKEDSEWGEYNFETVNEKKEYVNDKEEKIEFFIRNAKFKYIWDVGSNDGYYSRKIGTITKSQIISIDIDWKCIEKNYLINKKKGVKNITPILLDLSNPSPSIGWMNKERSNIFSRIDKPDLICLFAIMHHILNLNIPFDFILDFMTISLKYVIIEYIPISDPKAKIIFASRGYNFEYPNQSEFEKKITGKFTIVSKKKLSKTNRVLYFLLKK